MTRRSWVGLSLGLLLLCGPVFIAGVSETRRAEWSDDPDILRDMAQAQTLLDGRPLSDPFYRGERLWYPPLVPWSVGVASRLTTLTLPAFYTRVGAYLNGLAIIAFGVLVARLFGPFVALIAVFDTLYIRDPHVPLWASPGYTTTPYASLSVMILFCMALLAYQRALVTGSSRQYGAVGLLCGLTLLGHVAPAMILAVILVCDGLFRLRRDRGVYRQLAVVGATALLVALPLLWSIVGHYRLIVRNSAPVVWDWSFAGALDWEAFLAIAAVVWLARRERGPSGRILLWWIAAAAVLFATATVALPLGHPLGVPRHHFLYYLKAAQSVVIGWATARLLQRARAAAARLGAPRLLAGLLVPAALTLLLASVYAFAPTRLHSWLNRPAIAEARGPERRPLRNAAYEWLRANLKRDDVVLASDENGLSLLGPAGAHVVAIPATHSNPYVEWDSRAQDRDTMQEALNEGQQDRFLPLATRYGITHVLRSRSDGQWLRTEALPALELAYSSAGIRVYRVLAR